MKLTKYDFKILSVLKEDARASLQEISAKVGLSTTPCWKRIFSEKFPVGKIISLCVGTVVCKDFEKFKSSRVWECELCAVEFKDFEDFKVPCVWVWPLHCGT